MTCTTAYQAWTYSPCAPPPARWREARGSRLDFTLLDRNKKAGWDLASKLICRRDKYLRGRLSVSQALLHRFFLPEF